MEKRQMLMICTIGTRDISYKSITNIKVDRNFSDVGDKFTVELVDSPEVTDYDLELYMNAGYRDIIIKYGDLGTNKLTSYKGTIWDYTSTFVGNKKKLTITGICNRYNDNKSGASTYLYNIDWNNYINKREDEKEPYSAITSHNIRLGLDSRVSAIVDTEYRESLLKNTKFLKLTGPSKNTINIPIPDSFFSVNKDNTEDVNRLINDPQNKYWGTLHSEATTKEEIVCHLPNLGAAKEVYYKDGKAVACKIDDEYQEEHLFINIAYFVSVTKNFGPDFNVYTDTTGGIEGVDAVLTNYTEYFNDKPYYLVKDRNGKTIGFRTSNPNNTDNDVFINFTITWLKKNYTLKDNLLRDTELRKQTPEKQETADKTNYTYYYDNNNILRGFVVDNVLYVQANPNAESFGGARIIHSGHGVNISWIIKQLAILEGWKYKDEYIVQTEMVPNSDTFIMQNQSAFDFIQNNLIPKSVTPVGVYTSKDGIQKYIKTRQGGFGIFFDSQGYLHYQPISQTNLENIDIKNLGYNYPGSPTISFQVNTKGTAFYTSQPVKITATTITSGNEVSQVEVISDDEAMEIINTVGHNDTFDAWLGLNYNTVQKAVEKAKLNNDTSNNKSFSIDYNENYVSKGEKIQQLAYGLAQNALISSPTTKLVTSGVYNASDVAGNLKRAKTKIEDFTITANMNMWGDYRIKPAGIITITNMITGGLNNSNIPQKHPSSGKYMIQKVSESISSSNYIQSLDLIRFTKDLNSLINPYNIDYSKQVSNNFSKVSIWDGGDEVVALGSGGGGGFR